MLADITLGNFSKIKFDIKMFIRHFERWTPNGNTFDVEELDPTLFRYYVYPELFLVSDDFFT